jgi:NCS1 family nucleobase:cation symporter-1
VSVTTKPPEDVADSGQDPQYGDAVAAVEPYGIQPIPEGERHGKVHTQFTVYFAGNLNIPSFITGFYPVFYGLSLAQSLTAVLIGSALGALVLGYLATMGARLGVPQQVMGRGPLGYWANFLPVSVVSAFSAIGWATVTTVFGAWAIQGIVDIPFWICAALLCIGHGTLGVFGYNMIHFANKWSTIIFGALLVVITILALGEADLSFGVNEKADFFIGETGGWITAMGLFFGFLLTWAPVASDYSRYLPSNTPPGKIVAATALGNFTVMAWLGCLGVVVAHFAGALDPIQALKDLTDGFAPVTLLVVAGASICSASLNSYGGALSLLTLRIPFSREVLAAVVSFCAFLLALAIQGDLYGTFYQFVVASAYLIGPYMTVIALDYLLIRKRDPSRIREYYDRSRLIEWGFFAWVIGCLASLPFWVWIRYTGPIASDHPDWGDLTYYVGPIVTAVVFMLCFRLEPLSKRFRRGKGPDIEPVADTH